MNNIFKSTLLLAGAAVMLAACSTDNGSNPTLQQPDGFVLNTPAYAAEAIDLERSSSVNINWSQPDYGFPAEVTYKVELSPVNEWTVSYAEEQADESGETLCNYMLLEGVYGTPNAAIPAATIADALQRICKYEEGNVPAIQDTYLRVSAETAGATKVYSNVIKVNTIPYYKELKAAEPEIWFMTGAFAGWNNKAGGDQMIPFYVNPSETYDAAGLGNIEWTGYMPAGEFKIIAAAGLGTSDWSPGICGGNEEGGQTWREPGGEDGGNISVSTDGYWKLVVNTAAHTVSFEKLDITPKTYEGIYMPGSYQEGDGWNPAGDAMTLCNPSAGTVESHDWYKDVTYDSDCTLKFAAGSWDTNWGAADFPYGIGVQDGKDIPVKAGSYRVYFNDITGNYQFIAK